MTIETILPIFAIICFIAICIAGILYFVFRILLPKYKMKTHREDFEVLFAVFKAIIASEIELYDSNVFENNRPITNANYENFYMDLSKRILSKMSPELLDGLQHWMTEEALVSYVSRTVQKYLVQFVGDPL